MKNKRIDSPWGWEVGFVSTDKCSARLLFINKGSKLGFSGSRIFYCLEGMANLTISRDETTEILLLTPTHSHNADSWHEIEAQENTMLIEVMC